MKLPSKAKTRTAMRKAADLLRFKYDGRPREDIEAWLAKLDAVYAAIDREADVLRKMQSRIGMVSREAGAYIAWPALKEKSHEQK